MTPSPRHRVFLDYHSWSIDAQDRVAAGVQISDEEFDRMQEHVEARERQDREYRVIT